MLGAQPQPAPEVFHAGPPVPVRTDRTEEHQGGAFVAPFYRRQVNARHAIERGASLEPGFVGLCGAVGFGREGSPSALVSKGFQRRCDLLIALGELLVREGLQLDRLASGTQVCGAPGALARLGDVVLRVVAVWVAQLREVLRVALARDNGLEDGHAGHPGNITDDLRALEMHLFSGLWHRLHMVGGVGNEPLPVTERAAQHAHVGLGPQGASEPAVGRQALQPLAIEPSGFRSAGSALRLAGIDQEDLHAPSLSQFEQENPVDPGGCHGDGGHTTVNEPVGQGGEVGGAGAETTHGVGVAPRGHGAPGLGFTDVDARGMGVAELEGVGECG